MRTETRIEIGGAQFLALLRWAFNVPAEGIEILLEGSGDQHLLIDESDKVTLTYTLE